VWRRQHRQIGPPSPSCSCGTTDRQHQRVCTTSLAGELYAAGGDPLLQLEHGRCCTSGHRRRRRRPAQKKKLNAGIVLVMVPARWLLIALCVTSRCEKTHGGPHCQPVDVHRPGHHRQSRPPYSSRVPKRPRPHSNRVPQHLQCRRAPVKDTFRPSRHPHHRSHRRRRLTAQRGFSGRHGRGPPARYRRLPRPQPRPGLAAVVETQRGFRYYFKGPEFGPEARFLTFRAVQNFENVKEALVPAFGDGLDCLCFFSFLCA